MNWKTAETVRLLCNSNPEMLKKDGTINHNRAAELIGMQQSTFTRIINRKSKSVSDNSVQLIADHFHVSKAQVRGEEPLPLWMYPEDHPDRPKKVSEEIHRYLCMEIDQLIAVVRDLPPEKIQRIVDYARFEKSRETREE